MCWLFVNSQRSVTLDANASNNSDKASVYKGYSRAEITNISRS
ncbi:hypothetical protein VP193E371_P0157 [Vibrio phage 193E37-1]|nr:hypothetical protein VP193E371_P0157 [Vibrio phage 193E37-1]